jgi:sRNA-binding protein
MPQTLYKTACEKGITFYCPRGHLLSIGESDVDKMKKQLEEKDRRIEFERIQRQSAEKDRNVAIAQRKRAQTMLKNQSERVKNGVCPCCNRSFAKLAAHMKTKHPTWKGPK